MNSKIILSIFTIILLVGCSSPTPEATPTIPFLTLPPTFTVEPSPTISPNPTETKLPRLTNTPQPTRIVISTPHVFIGNPLPENPLPINAENINQLDLTAQWGKGILQMVAYSPTGDSFAAASNYGVAIYPIDHLAEPPFWIPFGKDFDFDNFIYNTDGEYLAVVGNSTIFIDIPNHQIVTNEELTEWPEVTQKFTSFYDLTVATSPDGSKEFRGGVSYIGYGDFYEKYGYERFTEEEAFKKVFDTSTGEVLYELTDETTYITYRQRTEPESCDIAYFSPCGNAVMERAAVPVYAAFSNDGNYFAVRYAIEGNSFSTLRIYEAETGNLISIFRHSDHQVIDFAFSPDSYRILVGLDNGAVHLWDFHSDQITFGAQHFNTWINGFSYSHDGRFLLVMRSNRLEIRSAQNGNLVASYNASAYALSPTENQVAIGDWDGIIRLRDIASGEIIHRFQGHSKKIFSVAFSDSGNFLASSSEDCTTRLWNARTGKFLHHMQVNTVDHEVGPNIRIFIWYLEFLPDSPLIMGFGSYGTAVSWDRNSGRTQLIVESAPLDFYQGMITVAPHYPGTFGIIQEKDQFIIGDTLYNLQSGEELGEYIFEEDAPVDCYSSGPVSTDGNLRFTRGYGEREGLICVLDNHTQKVLSTITVSSPNRWGYSQVTWPYLSPDGTQLIVPTQDGVIFVYQIGS
jgi:WD40 repeat protein